MTIYLLCAACLALGVLVGYVLHKRKPEKKRPTGVDKVWKILNNDDLRHFVHRGILSCEEVTTLELVNHTDSQVYVGGMDVLIPPRDSIRVKR